MFFLQKKHKKQEARPAAPVMYNYVLRTQKVCKIDKKNECSSGVSIREFAKRAILRAVGDVTRRRGFDNELCASKQSKCNMGVCIYIFAKRAADVKKIV